MRHVMSKNRRHKALKVTRRTAAAQLTPCRCRISCQITEVITQRQAELNPPRMWAVARHLGPRDWPSRPAPHDRRPLEPNRRHDWTACLQARLNPNDG